MGAELPALLALPFPPLAEDGDRGGAGAGVFPENQEVLGGGGSLGVAEASPVLCSL